MKTLNLNQLTKTKAGFFLSPIWLKDIWENKIQEDINNDSLFFKKEDFLFFSFPIWLEAIEKKKKNIKK